MPLHVGPIVVRFQGGFLDGHVSHSGEKTSGGITDFWNADAIYFATRCQIGSSMAGVSPEGLQAATERSGDRSKTFPMEHVYRVTRLTLEQGVMTIDVQYEFVE